MAEAGVPPAHADENANVDDAEIPTNLPSDVGFDYVPLATMLATGQLAEADQVRYYTYTEKIYQFFVLLLNYVIVVEMVCLDERKM